MRKTTALIGSGLLAALILLTGCEGGGAVGPDAVTDKVEAGSPAQTTEDAPREIIRNADVSVRVPDVRQSVAQAKAIAAEANGRTSSESVTVEGESVYAYLTLRVPAQSLDAVLYRLGQMGDVQTVNVTAEDVTTQVVDLDARISALQTSVDRLEQLLAQATSAQALVEIERELSARQAELDSLTAQRAVLADAVALSTVYVSLTPESEAAAFTPPGFLSGLESGWNALRTVVATAITAAGFLLPFALAIAVVAVPIIVVVIALRRRRHH